MITKNCCRIARFLAIHRDEGESDSTVYYNYDGRFSQGDNNIETDQVLGNRQDFSSNADKPDIQTPNGSEAVIGEDHIHPCVEHLQKVEQILDKLKNKQPEIPREKNQMLLHSLERIKSMEFDLDKTKRVMKQLEIAKLMENYKTPNLEYVIKLLC
ncbi:hypothetical protein POM88_048126 [Heracleum sosnowskyi]|uniref:Uncharacterized protein n=1 Tax=Heracleum sosnowskyi TaxID=360622 RepID=A0AAD8LY55_9APIA|nr:hypothetical protein POM88_048126 [Heracleum sosnowskyi]